MILSAGHPLLFYASLVCLADSHGVTVFEDGVANSKVSFAKFVKHSAHHLDVDPIASSSVQTSSQCAWACVETVTCFSFNVAAQPDIEGRTLCELLPTDKYNASDKFKANSFYQHHSISTPCTANPCKNGGTCVALYSTGDFNCTCLPRFHGKTCGKRNIHLKVRSEGAEDPGRTEGFGIAFIVVEGAEYSKQRRGHNIVALDTNATVHSTVYFDTYGDASAGVKMHDHINSLPNGTIVLVATQDSAERYYHDALAALESIGAPKSLNLGLHSSWYLVGYKGEPRPAWVTQGYAGRGLGPSEVEMEIVTDVGGSK